ncbi:MAG: hypothetical protein DRJ67_04085 [Thermoprotei archaeon]|nr:MAG: hypothetical protein DRJ67_04085 [Thermoprotei archaeon]
MGLEELVREYEKVALRAHGLLILIRELNKKTLDELRRSGLWSEKGVPKVPALVYIDARLKGLEKEARILRNYAFSIASILAKTIDKK